MARAEARVRFGGRLRRLIEATAARVRSLLTARVIWVDGARIGECGAHIGWFVQARRLGWMPPLRTVVVPFPRLHFANRTYIDYWRGHVHVVSSRVLYPLVFRLAVRLQPSPSAYEMLPDGRRVEREDALIASHSRWEDAGEPPLLTLRPEHERRGRAALASLGLGADDWFVSLHVRESGYLHEPPDSYRLYRNADVDTYLDAAQRIVDRGGWVIRMGDPSMKPVPELDRVIDYVHGPLYSDWMDVYLAASCRFFLGTSSGLFVVAWSFGRPCALANWDSLRRRPWASQDLFMPKLWRISSEERYLNFDEVMSSPYVDELYGHRARPSNFSRLGVDPVDNTTHEIADLVDEMFDRLEGAVPNPEDERRLALFNRVVGYGFPDRAGARVSSHFLLRHRDLLPSPSNTARSPNEAVD